MKKKYLFLIFSFSILHAQEYIDYGNPIIVLTEYNPDALILYYDSPTFCLYDTGIIIYKDGELNDYVSVKLNEKESDGFISSLNIAEAFYDLPRDIATSTWTDQFYNEITLNLESSARVEVYGNLRDNDECRDNTPKPFLNLYDKLIEYKNSNTEIWRPKKIEVMLREFNYSREEPAKWSADWPSLSDSNYSEEDDFISIYLDSHYYEQFMNFLNGLDENQAVEINGKTYAVTYRFPFPNLEN